MGKALLTTEITGIAAGGAGVGRLPDGRVTFVQRTAPGDVAVVRLVEEKPRWTRGELVRLETPSGERRPAPCPHYDRCGGCTLEHLSYPAQLEAKSRLISDALRRIGKRPVSPPDVVPSPREFRYRNRVTFTLRRGRSGVVAGFHALEEPDTIVDITEACLLPEAAIAAVWKRLRREWGPDARRLPSGDELRLTLRASAAGAVSLAIDGGYAPGRPRELLGAVDDLESIWHRAPGGAAYGLLAGDASLREEWAGEELDVSGDVFTQVNRAAAPGRALDAYCGVGLYARRLERMGVEVVGVEAHPAAVAEARRAAPASRILEGRLEDRIGEVLPVDLAILNPPRAGVDAAVAAGLRAAPPRVLVYVSCDPATLARDVQRLGAAFELVGVRGFDLFPQTAHVETVVEMRCVTT